MGSGCGVTEVIGDGEGVAGVNAASGVIGDNVPHDTLTVFQLYAYPDGEWAPAGEPIRVS